MTLVTDSPPRAPPVKYTAPLGTRWDKEKAAAGGASAFDLPTDPKNIGPWILGECVGKGASGRVKIAKHKRTGQLAAVKILPVAPLVNSRASLATQKAKSEKLRLGIDREITMMKLMNHPNIMRIYDVFEGDKELFLVLEYVEGGELFDFLVNRGRLPPNEALEYFRQIVYGLNYAHTFSIIHRDLKPENILIASLTPPLIKIADWGMAAFAPPSLQLETSCGSPHYASPEIVNGEKYQGNATDIWSCGVILFALLTGRLPFDDKNVRTLLSKVKSGKFDMPAWIDPLAKDLLERMLVVDVKKRITIPEILSHPWLLTQSPASSMSAPSTSNFLVPLMPPSPSTLARPIASPHLIDPELLLSLRIIWGRHTDSQGTSIIRDLCAPAGHGVHAKAFYFLLNMYREETSRNRMAEANNEGGHKQSDSALGTVKFNLGRKTDQTRLADRFNGVRNSVNAAISPAPPSPRHPGLSGPIPPVMHRGKTVVEEGTSPRIKLGSPIGPRPPPLSLHDADRAQPDARRTQVRKRETTPLARPKVSMGPRPAPTSRGNTYSSFAERQTIEALPTGTPVSLQSGAPIQRQKMKASPSADLPTLPTDVDTDQVLSSSTQGRSPSSRGAMAGSMVSTTQTPSAPMSRPIANVTMGLNLPLLTAPQTDDPQLQKTMDEITKRVNIIVQAAARSTTLTDAGVSIPSTNADEAQMSTKNANPLPLSQRITEPREVVDTHIEAQGINMRSDKENRNSGEEGWSYVDVSNEQSGLGLGVGVSREMGKELVNIGNIGPDTSPAKNKKGKEKKTRPPPIELPSLHPKRSTISMLGSPIALASAVHNPTATNSNRLLASPVVGEFKGWFSNLFNWKLHQSTGQGGVVYSVYEPNRTREDVVKLLETLGFSVMKYPMEYPSDIELLSCRLDRQITDPASNTTLKPLRLRVEISTGCGFSSQPSPAATGDENPYFKPSVPSTHSNYLTTPTSATIPRPKSAMIGGKGSAAYPTPLPSPIGFPKWELPRGCACAIALVHEKGSMSTFRAVWRKVKDMYGDSPAPYPCFSPAMATTPFVEHQQRFAV